MEKGKPTKIQDLTKLFMKLSDQARKNKEKNDKEFDNTAVVRPIENDSQYGGQRKQIDRDRIGKDARASLAVYEDKDEKKDDDSVQRAMNKKIVIINPDLDPDSEDSAIKGKGKDKKNMSESHANIIKFSQFISQQKEKNDFGYPNPINEETKQTLKVHFNEVGSKKIDPITITRTPKSWETNDNIIPFAKKHPDVRSVADQHGTSVKKVAVIPESHADIVKRDVLGESRSKK